MQKSGTTYVLSRHLGSPQTCHSHMEDDIARIHMPSNQIWLKLNRCFDPSQPKVDSWGSYYKTVSFLGMSTNPLWKSFLPHFPCGWLRRRSMSRFHGFQKHSTSGKGYHSE